MMAATHHGGRHEYEATDQAHPPLARAVAVLFVAVGRPVSAEPPVPSARPLKTTPMILSTTPALEGYDIVEYIGVVSGHAIVGANVASDFLAGVTGFFGGRSTAYEKKVRKAEEAALQEITDEASARGATAIVGLHLDFESLLIKDKDALLAMAACGTAVKAVRRDQPSVDRSEASSVLPPPPRTPAPPKQNWEKLSPLVDTPDPGRANRPA